MLLRWIVNQYLREAGQGKVRDVVGGLIRAQGSAFRVQDVDDKGQGTGDKSQESVVRSHEAAEEFLPCDVVFIFALGIESGGLVDRLKGEETSRHKHGTERAGKLG